MASPLPFDPDAPEALVVAAGGGDVDAFARIVRLHHEGMTRTALLVTDDLAMAIEAVVEAWDTAWPRLAHLEDPGRLGSWLGSLAVDEALFLVRHARTRERPAAGPGRAPQHEDLARALASMTPEDRALLARHHLAGLEVAELARGPFRNPNRTGARLARLSEAVAGALPPGATQGEAMARAGVRLRAHVTVKVLPVHADQAARQARDETALERGRMVSVAICAVVGMLVAAAPYLVRLAYHRG